MSKVFVLDTNKQQLNPIHPGRARTLLDSGKATIFKRHPFTIRLKVAINNPVVADLRMSNLCLACEKCNLAKGTKDIAVFLKKKPDLLKKILAQAKAPLRDAAAVNATRWQLFRRLEVLGLPVECGSGGLTKYNRTTRELPKTHWVDAACVGKSTPEALQVTGVRPLAIIAYGHGCRQMCLMNRYGFPRTDPKAKHFKHGFKTGDIVKAIVPDHLKNAGTHEGRISAKAGSFDIATKAGKVTQIGKKYCRKLQRADGYGYIQRSA